MIEVDGLTKFYGARCAISNVTFEVTAGQVVGFLGLNGAGKTTILRILAGDLEPSAGQIIVGGHDLVDHPAEYRRQVGFLPEGVPIYPDMTVYEYLSFIGSLRSVERGNLKSRVDQVCERVDIGSYLHEPCRHLSQGYRKRLGIAGAIIHNPDLVILDEPISGLDPVQIVGMRKLIRSLSGDHTVLLSSHILTEISQTCDSILMLSQGQIMARGSESELKAQHDDRHQIEITCRGASPQVTPLIQAIDGIQKCDVVSESDGLVSLKIAASSDIREQAVVTLTRANIGILRLDRSTNELEAAFIAMSTPPVAGNEVAT